MLFQPGRLLRENEEARLTWLADCPDTIILSAHSRVTRRTMNAEPVVNLFKRLAW